MPTLLILIIFPLNMYGSISEKIYPVELVKTRSVISTSFKNSNAIKEMSTLARQNLHETKKIHVMTVNNWSVF